MYICVYVCVLSSGSLVDNIIPADLSCTLSEQLPPLQEVPAEEDVDETHMQRASVFIRILS